MRRVAGHRRPPEPFARADSGPVGASGIDPVDLVVGRIGRAHGIRGEVSVELRTDDPDARFAPGAHLRTDPVARGPLTVRSARPHAGRLLVFFDGVADRTAADALRGTFLVVSSADLPPIEDPDEFYDLQLVGLGVVTVDGQPVGEVTEVAHPPGHDLLVVLTPEGREIFIPFVSAIVPQVDLARSVLVIDPPAGLLDLDEVAPTPVDSPGSLG